MAPRSSDCQNESSGYGICAPPRRQPRLQEAAKELESLRVSQEEQSFPPACMSLLRYHTPGNDQCIDCGNLHPQWATASFGALICIQCSGKHRSLGVQTSFVRSLTMDTWSYTQVLSMLEGGNQQLRDFLVRHRMEPSQLSCYRTKAARFYRENLRTHTLQVSGFGTYQGREVSRTKIREVSKKSLAAAR